MSETSSIRFTLAARRWALAGGAALGLLLAVPASVQANSANSTSPAPFALTLVCPPDTTVECFGDAPAALSPEEFIAQGGQITSDCPDTVRIEHLDSDLEGDCPATFTRFYSATDACGGFSSCQQQITVSDSTPPTIKCPEGGELPCNTPNVLVVGADDNCDSLVDIVIELTGGTNLGNVNFVDNGDGTFTLTFTGDATAEITATATDDCRNENSCKTTFTATCAPPPPPGEGCTPGFWKNHTGLWNSAGDPIAAAAGFTTTTSFNAFFGLTPAQSGFPDSKTMLGAMQSGGGGGFKLARHGLAALLNLAAGVNVPLPANADTPAELVAAMTNAYVTGVFEPLATQIAAGNNTQPEGCPGK